MSKKSAHIIKQWDSSTTLHFGFGPAGQLQAFYRHKDGCYFDIYNDANNATRKLLNPLKWKSSFVVSVWGLDGDSYCSE